MDKVYIIGKDSVSTKIRLDDGQEFRACFVALPGSDAELSLEIDINGRDCLVDIAGLSLCKDAQKVDFNVTVRHNSAGSRSYQNFLSIASGESRTYFNGLVYVAPGAAATKAEQLSRSLLLDSRAFVEARPQLEIYADDVECSHGCTSGYLDEDELFYLRSRGIPEQQARKFQMIAFLSPVLGRLEDEELKQKIYDSLP